MRTTLWRTTAKRYVFYAGWNFWEGQPLIIIHSDGVGDLLGRREAAGDAGSHYLRNGNLLAESTAAAADISLHSV